MEKILVTGGSAVAGDGLKSIVSGGEYPGREFIFPSSRDLNLLDFESTRSFVRDYSPDAIVHFAAISGGIQLTKEHPASIMRDNIAVNFNVVEAARLANTPNVMLTSSVAAYPLQAEVPMKEESFHNGFPHESNYGYAFAKRLIDPMIKSYNDEYGMNLTGITPGAIIGPRSNFNPESSTAIPSIIRILHGNRNSDAPIKMLGDGSAIRQFTSDEDIGRIAMWFVDNYSGTESLNVATPEETSIRDASYMIAEYVGIDKNRLEFGTDALGVHSQSLDSSKFLDLSEFKYAPTRGTIKRTVDYFVENYPDSEKLRL